MPQKILCLFIGVSIDLEVADIDLQVRLAT